MKTKNLFVMLPLFLGIVGLTNCSDDPDGPDPDVIWDIYPFSIPIRVVDTSGNDLLDPDTEGSLADKGIKAIYKGTEFVKDSGVPAKTKALNVQFTGLRSYKSTEGKYMLVFGDFNGDLDYLNQEIILDWNDGSKQDTIVFNHHFYWENHEPASTNVFSLNGVETEAPIVIVK